MTALKKILHVDDDERVLRMTARFLEQEGFVVVSTTSPFIAPVIQQEQPSLILMDVDMPLLSGDRIVSILRDHDFSSLPIIFFSAKPVSELAALSEQVPASSYVSKDRGLPFLVERIRRLTAG